MGVCAVFSMLEGDLRKEENHGYGEKGEALLTD